MKTILVATDFSPAAHNALMYAVKMATYVHAKVVLLNVYQTVNYISDMVVMVPDQELREENEELLLNEFAQLSEEQKEFATLRCELGSATDTIISVAAEIDADWIVVGMKRSDKTFRKIFGSTVLSLRRVSSLPLIIVPEEVTFTGIKKIALASDLTAEHDIHLLDPLVKLGSAFHSNVYVVKVLQKYANEETARGQVPYNVKWCLKELSPGFEFLKDDNFSHALNTFIHDHEVQMLAMVAHPHSILERMFVRSSIKEMLFKANVPILILPGFPGVNLNDQESSIIEMAKAAY
ncbi:MAG: universal stress protein [Segetibacter sp.]|nr:universal stress protein [Segetibacter sp.]